MAGGAPGSSCADGDYAYRFRVKSLSYFAKGETFDVFDPYALEVTDDEHSIVRVRRGERAWTEYQWQHDHVPLPQNHELVIYELFVADFDGGRPDAGRFDDVIARLDGLKEVGINCIELMPVKFFQGNGWGYNVRSLFAVASSYGAPEDLCRLVDECHARGMRVVIDGVYNHADQDAPLAKIDYAYWFYEQNPDPPEMQWGPKYNLRSLRRTFEGVSRQKIRRRVDSVLDREVSRRRDSVRCDARPCQFRCFARADRRRLRASGWP